MSDKETVIEQVDMSLEDILGSPGVEDILIPDADKKPNILSSKTTGTLSFLDKEEEKEEDEDSDKETPDLDKVLNSDIEEEEEEEKDSKQTTKKRVDKAGIVGMFKDLIDKEKLVPFDDDKTIDQYDIQDFEELIHANIEQLKESTTEDIKTEFFESLPAEFQYAAAYFAQRSEERRVGKECRL